MERIRTKNLKPLADDECLAIYVEERKPDEELEK